MNSMSSKLSLVLQIIKFTQQFYSNIKRLKTQHCNWTSIFIHIILISPRFPSQIEYASSQLPCPLTCLVAFSMDSMSDRTEHWLAAPRSLLLLEDICRREVVWRSFSTLLRTLRSLPEMVRLPLGKVGEGTSCLAWRKELN